MGRIVKQSLIYEQRQRPNNSTFTSNSKEIQIILNTEPQMRDHQSVATFSGEY